MIEPAMRAGWIAYGVLGLVAALGCSRGALQRDAGPNNDAGILGGTGSGGGTGAAGGTGSSGGTGSGGATWAVDGGDAAPQLIGLRSFVVTSTLTQQPDVGTSPLPIAADHRFTMVVDWTARTVITGANGSGNAVPITPSANGGAIALAIVFTMPGNSGVTYESLEFAVAPEGTLTGVAAGYGFYQPNINDLSSRVRVTASLAGVPDAEPPTLSAKVGGTTIDPFDVVKVTSSEPMPPGTWLTLLARQGSRVDLPPLDGPTGAAFSFAQSPFRMWRFNNRYTLLFQGVVDFAGNAATGGAIFFTTGPPPPLAAEDGFEGVAETTLGGAQVLSGPEAPIISGARSLFIPSSPETPPPGRNGITQLALRLSVAPTDTVVRFSYRSVNPPPYLATSADPNYLLGAPDSEISSARLGTYTESPSSAMIPGVGEVSLGPLTKAEFLLPPGAISAGEVTFVRRLPACCGGLPAFPVAGLILDDLRAE